MSKIAWRLLGLCFICGTVFADPGDRDEQDAISLSLAKEKPHPTSGFIIDPETGAVTEQTPTARYLRDVKKRVGIRWNAYVTPVTSKLGAQSTRVGFKVRRDGTVFDVEILEAGKSTEEFRSLCLRAVRDTKCLRIPASVDTAGADTLEVAYSFTIYAP